jgi:hypothetical protein
MILKQLVVHIEWIFVAEIVGEAVGVIVVVVVAIAVAAVFAVGIVVADEVEYNLWM